MESRRHVGQRSLWNTATANQRRGQLPFQTRGTVLLYSVHVNTQQLQESNNRGIPCFPSICCGDHVSDPGLQHSQQHAF